MELKAFNMPRYAGQFTTHEVYLKSEVDKVIAELEGRIADGDRDFELANHQNEMLLKIVRHHKYKRCLAVARWCHNEGLWWYSKGYGFEKYDKFWEKWEKRWLALADKFKEAK